MADWILHVDLDQFQVSVELRRRPELRGEPVVVGGSGDATRSREVVTCASYEARALGIRAGMPLRTAARRHGDLVFLPADAAAYERASGEVTAALRALPVRVEVWGWDEAFLGARTDDPEALAARIRATVTAETGLSCSVGIGDNKQRAKLATGFAKPAGTYRLDERNWMSVMADRPTDALWGVGKKTAAKLTALGIGTVADLADADEDTLVARFGPATGPWYRDLARGGGDTVITTAPREPRSRSHSRTFPRDLTDRADVDSHLAELAEWVARETTGEGREVTRVAVTVRYPSFVTRTRITTLGEPTRDAAVVVRAARTVLARFDLERPVRLLGVRVELAPHEGRP